MTDWAVIYHRLAADYGYTFGEINEMTPAQVKILMTEGKPTVLTGPRMDRYLRRVQREGLR